MNNPAISDTGLIEVLLERLNKQRLPHALQLQKKVDAGEVLNDFDMEFLAAVIDDTNAVKPIYDRHPEYQPLISKVIELYTYIVLKAAENEAKHS
ncbi:hypothetical protein WKI13_12715 [Teredinibacter turnerae]|uniref:hypothetical protein n=1 Tax=Teredinibacter turnerae TaxID=2426 RepID=UPI000381549E|nr:hypothetical protein [Teredinibacter turnerae]